MTGGLPLPGACIPHALTGRSPQQSDGNGTARKYRQPLRTFLRLMARGHGPVLPLYSGMPRSKGSEFPTDLLTNTPVGRIVRDALTVERDIKEAA